MSVFNPDYVKPSNPIFDQPSLGEITFEYKFSNFSKNINW